MKLQYLDQREIAELEKDKIRWRVRRRLTISAFFTNTLMGIAYILLPIILDSAQINSLKEFNSIIISLMGSNSTIILLYIGAVTYSDSSGISASTKLLPFKNREEDDRIRDPYHDRNYPKEL